jgi:trk system potassium uptake protein TrkH
MPEIVDEILSTTGGILKVIGGALLVPVVAAVVYTEYISLFPFLVCSFVSLASGVLINLRYPMKDKLSIEATIIIAPMAWILVSAVGGVPYNLLLGSSPMDAFFESMSGFTTTGMTLLQDLESLPKALLLWRSLTQWIGGAGVILLFAVFLRGGISTWRLYSLEGREEKFTPSIGTTIKSIWVTYMSMTAICAVLLFLCGMSPFDAINHSFTALSTGGFSTRTDSIAAFGNPLVEIVLSAFMVLAAINFALYYNLFKLNIRRVINDVESKTMFIVIIIAGALVALMLGLSYSTVAPTITNSYFNVISIITTTGYTSTNLLLWPLTAQVLLLILMLLGGSAGSTAGGLKIWRAIVLYKVGKREVERISLPPSAVQTVKIGGKILGEDYIMKVGAFFFVYIMAILIQFLIISINIHDPWGALSLVVSAQSNVGPAFYSMEGLDSLSKIVLVFGMWFGRLELFSVLALFSRGIPAFIKEAYLENKKENDGKANSKDQNGNIAGS